MKKIIFIDNDSQRYSEGLGDLDHVTNLLEANGFFQFFKEEEIIPIYDFYRDVDKEKAYELLFDNNNVICTYSMYSATHYNSLEQLFTYLIAAGINEIKNMVYIDCSGQIVKALNRNLRDVKQLAPVICAIETNYILTVEDATIKKVKVQFKGLYDDCIVLENFDISKIIE